MRTFTAQQRALAASATIKPILLLVLTTYSDRALGTVDTVYYFSDRPVLYDYGNTGTVRQFDAVLMEVTDLTQSIPHVPGTTPAGLEAELRVTLSNLPYLGGDPLIQELRSNNLEFATIELSSVYGPLDADTGWYDLRAYTGDEHLVELRAEIEMAEGIDDQVFQLRCKTIETPFPWTKADDATITDPKDLGARLPIVYGASKRVPCIGWQVGWTTTLAALLGQGIGAGSQVIVTDPTGFPITAFDLSIDGETISIAARASASDILVIVLRGVGSSYDSDHNAGASVQEVIAEAIFVAAGHRVSSIDAVYARNPFNGELFGTPTVATSAYDTALNGWATLRLSAADQKSFYIAASTAARITQQAEYSAGTGSYSYEMKTPAQISYATVGGAGRVVSGSTITIDLATPGQVGVATFLPSQGLSTTRLVTQIRFYANVAWNFTGSYGNWQAGMGPWGTGMPPFPNGVYYYHNFAGNSSGSGGIIQSGWMSYGGYESQLVGKQLVFFIGFLAGWGPIVAGSSITLSNWGIECEYYSAPVITRVSDAAATGPGVGFALDLFADVSGPPVPARYIPGYAFDDATGWSVAGCTVAADTSNKTEGTGSLKLTAVETVFEDCEATTSWTPVNCTVALDAATHSQGSNSFVITATATATIYVIKGSGAWGAGINATDSLIAFDVRVTAQSAAGITANAGMFFGVSSQTTILSPWREWSFGSSQGITLANGCVTIVIDPATYPNIRTTSGAVDYSSIKCVWFGLDQTTAGSQLWVDNIRIVPKVMIAQRNATSGVVDLSAAQATYRVALRGGETGETSAGELAWSNTAGSGTTLPATYRTLTFASGDLSVGSFTVLEATTTDTGSPGVNNAETVRVAVTLNPSSRGVLAGPAVVWIDELECSAAVTGYAGTLGNLIEQPADIVRHLLTETCGLASSYSDSATLTSWAANLPSGFKIGCDLRALGETLPELLARIGYEGRANLIRAEGAATSVYKALCAETDYTWPGSSGRALTSYQSLSEVGRDGREIATRFQFLYGRDPSIGSDLSAFHGLVRANPTVSDVSVSAATLATREQKYGRRDAAVGVLLAHYDEASAEDVAGYYVAEAGRDAGTFLLAGVAWWEAADLELGDLVDLAPPWRSGTLKVRAIEIKRRYGAGVVDLRAVEVA